MEELDAIQLELETLLSSVALRYRHLKVEYDYLEDRKHQKKNANRGKAGSPSTSGKRKRDDKKSSSKDSGRGNLHTKHSKIKRSSSNSPAHSQHTDQSGNIDSGLHTNPNTGHSNTNTKPILSKNDIPNKFWLSIEPYCMPITQEDIKLLDDLIDDYSEPLVPIIPELGPHYAVRWTSDDIRDDQDGSSSNTKSTKRLSSSNSNSNLADVKDTMTNENEKVMGQGICGPLTQRLLSAFLEENNEMQSDIVGCSDGNAPDGSDNCPENNPSSANRARATSMNSLFKSGIDVEKRLKKELIDIGLLEPSDFAKEDEVLNEIKRVRAELQAIAEYNRDELNLLKAAAKEEMKRLEVKRRIDRVDQEVNHS